MIIVGVPENLEKARQEGRAEGFEYGQRYTRVIEAIENLTKNLIEAQSRYVRRRFLDGGVDIGDLNASLELQTEAQKNYLAVSGLIELAYAINPEKKAEEKRRLNHIMSFFDINHIKLVDLTLPELLRRRQNEN